MKKDILVVIPARGGSKGIPRKNLRLLNNKPLIFYSIKTALSSRFNLDVYVSSEDEEILNTATQFGAKTYNRDKSMSEDSSTLDPVIYSCYEYAKEVEKKDYAYIITMQPTSPLLSTNTLDDAIQITLNSLEIETTIAVKDDTHLTWKKENNKFIPNYKERVNRQYLTPIFTETGGFFITRNDIMANNNRIGNKVELYALENGEEIDIDTYQDWNLCEYYLKRKHILFVVTGNKVVGLGHVYNTLLIANDILNHKITFLVDKESKLAFDKISSKNYPVFIQTQNDILEDIKNINPDIVINDVLDTDIEYIKSIKELDMKVINFEDLGEGAESADLVINAIYPEKKSLKNHFFGYEYFALRDEFIFSKQKKIKKEVKSVLITFGGVDLNNYTKRVLEIIYSYCQENKISITTITGFGYKNLNTLKRFKNINILENVINISAHMLEADIIFTSAGRTTYEIASVGTPAIVLAQNKRELTHFFASSEFGFLNLGLGYELENKTVFKEFIKLVNSYEDRKYMSELMKKIDLRNGRTKVIKLIQNLI